MNRNLIISAWLLIAISLPAQHPDDLKRNFDQADQQIVRLPPKAFPQLPGNIVRELERRGCTIPQETYTKKPHNVIRGEFARPGQMDWALLCSVNRVSTILVFWNGSAKNAAEVATMEDRIFLQGVTPDRIGFSRGITPVGRDFIVRHYQLMADRSRPISIIRASMTRLLKKRLLLTTSTRGSG